MLKKSLLLLPCLFTIVLAGWYPEEQITTSRTGKDLRQYNSRKVVVATNGVRHLVWSNYYNRYYPGSGWTADYKLSRKGWHPAIALDPNGTDIHVVWVEGYDIYYQKCVPGSSGTGGWVGSPINISHKPSGTAFLSPSLACYIEANNVHHIVVVWFTWLPCPRLICFCECIDGNWGQPIYFENPSGQQSAWYPSMAVDPLGRQGEVFLSMHVDDGSLYAKRRVNGAWQPWENIGASGRAFMDVDPGTGCPHIVFDATGIYHTYRDPSGGWQPVEKISGEDALQNGRPSMAFSNGSAFVVWSETTSTAGGVRYTIGQYGNWTSPDWLTHRYFPGGCDWVSAAASPTGDVYTVYVDEVGRYTQLFGRLYTPAGERAQATNEGIMGNQVNADLLNLIIAPNPAIDLATVRYSVPVFGPVTLKLYDVIGREITTLAQGTHEPGRYHIDLDTHTLAQGIYYLKYESGNYYGIKKLIIQR